MSGASRPKKNGRNEGEREDESRSKWGLRAQLLVRRRKRGRQPICGWWACNLTRRNYSKGGGGIGMSEVVEARTGRV